VTLVANGRLQIESGFIRPEDEPRVEIDDAGEDGPEGRDANISSHEGNGSPVVVNGKPVSGAAEPREESEDEGIKPLPDRLVFDLTAERTLARRSALPTTPTSPSSQPCMRSRCRSSTASPRVPALKLG
jgi:ParB family transcriptional regulator, chromosome partitioning protein